MALTVTLRDPPPRAQAPIYPRLMHHPKGGIFLIGGIRDGAGYGTCIYRTDTSAPWSVGDFIDALRMEEFANYPRAVTLQNEGAA